MSQHANFFNPVTSDPTKMTKLSKTPVDFVVERLDEPIEALQARVEEVEKHFSSDGSTYITGAFAVLDERSTQDETVLVYWVWIEFDTEVYTDFDKDSKKHLVHWRIPFADAHEVVGMLDEASLALIDPIFIDAPQQYTNDAGVFEFRKAFHTDE